MDKYRNFTIDVEKNQKLSSHSSEVSRALQEMGPFMHMQTLFANQKMSNDYDIIVLNKVFLRKDFYLNIDFIVGGYREYLKLNCDIFARDDAEIDSVKLKLEEICKIKN